MSSDGARVANILLIPGDGVGPEVIREARRVLEWLCGNRGLKVRVGERNMGIGEYERTGSLMSDEAFVDAMAADAILFGAFGGPGREKVPHEHILDRGLLGLRRHLDLFANLRPIKTLESLSDTSPMKPEVAHGTDFVIVRELTSGVYYGEPRGIETLSDGSEKGTDTQAYTTGEIERIARVAFALAARRGGRVGSVDKANVMKSGVLWRRVVTRLAAEEFPGIVLDHMYADNCAMQLIIRPTQFDVILTDNLFGDVLSDGAAAIVGSLGMLPSASLGPEGADGTRKALYEPVHGTAPDLTGKNAANPVGAILSLAMALRYSLGRPEDADLVEDAVDRTITAGVRTQDIAGSTHTPVSTPEFGGAVLAELDRGIGKV